MSVTKSLLAISLFLGLQSTGTAAESPAETYFLLRCDDMGMCHSLNMALEKVMDSGIPVSTSVMFACPWYQEAVDILKQHPDVAVGIHLTLNAEWKNYRWGPVAGAEAVPTLVDSCGYFYPSRSALFAGNPDIHEIEKELRAQINRAMQSGIKIDYLDYHMGAAVETPELRSLVESLAREYHLGMSGYFGEIYSNCTYSAPLGSKTDTLLAHLRRIQPGVNLQVVHTGLMTAEMNALKDMNKFGLPDMSRNRQEELKAITSKKVRKLLKKRGIRAITYRDLIEMRGLESMHRDADSNY